MDFLIDLANWLIRIFSFAVHNSERIPSFILETPETKNRSLS